MAAIEDVTGEASFPAWQRTLQTWQAPIAFGPFVLVLAPAETRPFNALPHWTVLPMVGIPIFWAVAIKGYLLYLTYQK